MHISIRHRKLRKKLVYPTQFFKTQRIVLDYCKQGPEKIHCVRDFFLLFQVNLFLCNKKTNLGEITLYRPCFLILANYLNEKTFIDLLHRYWIVIKLKLNIPGKEQSIYR